MRSSFEKSGRRYEQTVQLLWVEEWSLKLIETGRYEHAEAITLIVYWYADRTEHWVGPLEDFNEDPPHDMKGSVKKWANSVTDDKNVTDGCVCSFDLLRFNHRRKTRFLAIYAHFFCCGSRSRGRLSVW